jgi:hypothetical protein
MTISAAKPFETANLPWTYAWKGDRQPSKHGSIEDLLAHGYTAAEVALKKIQEAVLPICPDILIEISRSTTVNGFEKIEKDYMPLKDATIHTIGPNVVKSPHSTVRKLAEDDHKEIDNIGDVIRFRLIVPKYGPSKANKTKSIQMLNLITTTLNKMALGHEGNNLDITSYKDRHLHPSDEGFRDSKYHFSVIAPDTFPEIQGVKIPPEFLELYKDVFNKQAIGSNGHVKRFDNPVFAGEPVSCELQIMHESMLDADKITDIIRAHERSVAGIKRDCLFKKSDFRLKGQHDVSNLEGILRRFRSNITNITARDSGLNEIVTPEFIDRTLLLDLEIGRSKLAMDSIRNISNHQTIKALEGDNIINLALRGTGNGDDDKFRKMSRRFK